MALRYSFKKTDLGESSNALRFCKFCQDKKFASKSAFISHLTTNHSSIEGGSYICLYGDNKICNACPGVGVSHTDYIKHVNKHHVQVSLVTGMRNCEDKWTVNSSCVNVPAVLNDPAKGKQKDFFTRSWGVDFVDSTLLPSSPYVCELPPNCFDRYIRKVRKHYSGHKSQQGVSQSCMTTPATSRETTPSPLPTAGGPGTSSTSTGSPDSKLSYSTTTQSSPPRRAPEKLDIPPIFFDQNFDLSNPATFNSVFSFLQDSLTERRANPFQIDSGDVRIIEKSGKLLQEKLSHHLDQVEVSIAHQVAAKSHHFFQVMTYHDALMSQLRALITVVKTLRHRLGDVEKGVVLALKVPQMCLRKQNLEFVIKKLNIVHTLHQTQPTIQVLLSRQEFSGALDLISTSQDIIKDDLGEIVSLRHLPSQLDQLMQVIGRMLLADFKTIVTSDLEDETNIASGLSFQHVLTDHADGDLQHNGDRNGVEDCESSLDVFALSSLVSGLIRQESYSFLEYFEDAAINTIKRTIKDVVLEKLDLNEEKTLTNLVAEFALVATSDEWTELLDLLVGSLIIVLRKMNVIHRSIKSCLNTRHSSENSIIQQDENSARVRLKQTSEEVMINICDQVHERLGKLVTVRSRPNAVKLVSAKELSTLQTLINILSKVTLDMCGKCSAGLQLSHQGQTILYIQQFHESSRTRLANLLEKEKWRPHTCKPEDLDKLKQVPLDLIIWQPTINNSTIQQQPSAKVTNIQELRIVGCDDGFSFVESVVIYLHLLSDYISHLTDLPSAACVEVALKLGDLLKLFNSRTCQLVLGAGAVSLAGLKTITIRNLAITLRSLEFVTNIIPHIRSYFMDLFPNLTAKQYTTIERSFDNAVKDYNDHLGELDRKIQQIVDAAMQVQLATWQRKPPVPSNSFKSIGKQLTKFHEAVQDILPHSRVNRMFRNIHNQFLKRVADALKSANLRPDNSPSHGLVVSELIFYRENLKYMNVLSPEDLHDAKLQTVWSS